MNEFTLTSGSPTLAPTIAPIQVPAVMHPYLVQKPAHLEVVENAFNKWLYIEDQFYVENLLATYRTLQFPGDPYWEIVIGAPGIGKTEGMMSLTTLPDTYMLSKLTPHTLMSGLTVTDKNGEVVDDSEYDLYRHLVGKVVIIKDASSIGGLRSAEQKQIYADFREAFDGRIDKGWGSKKGARTCKGTFGLMIGTTPTADASMRTFNEALGERFCRFRLRCKDTSKAITKASECSGREEMMRIELQMGVQICMTYVLGQSPTHAYKSDDVDQAIRAMADLCARLRTPVKRDRRDNIFMKPEPEVATRLVKQCERMPTLT